MRKIDDATSVPLYWLVSAVVFACAGAWGTAWLVFDMRSDIHHLKGDMKLVKTKLNIPAEEDETSSTTIIHDAEAHK